MNQQPQQTSGTPYFGVFDLFKIGIGPSSSHSVGPMIAANRFIAELRAKGKFDAVTRVRIDLFGSLALTGIGHGTDKAVLLGLLGHQPDKIDPDTIDAQLDAIAVTHVIHIAGERQLPFHRDRDLVFHRDKFLERHPNGMRFTAFVDENREYDEATYFSIGGGFVVGADEAPNHNQMTVEVPFPFSSARELLDLASQNGCTLSDLARANERQFRSDEDTRQGLQKIWKTMQDCVERGCQRSGVLPGGLNVERRAPDLFAILTQRSESVERDPLCVLDWVDLFALAVNEENAAGGRVVTAPTNGAAGIIPAVLHYFDRFCPAVTPEKIEDFLLTAALIGSLYKQNASISGAEVGCQGEVGVACSMAAGALTEVLGGTPSQVEEAAEIGMEHNLGLTCDPIKGLVQVPCIERNAMGAVKAINASRLALRGDGKHFVSLDRVIRVMKRTGADMSARYKETSRGGLAVNVTEC